MRLKDKVCIITGGAMGIGKAIAKRLVSEGASVCIADIDMEASQATLAELTAEGGAGSAMAVECNVNERADIIAAIEKVVERYGRLDVMFNNAGVARLKPFLDVTEDDWNSVMQINGLGVLMGMQEAAKQFISQGGGGKIVNTASVAGKQGFALVSHYSASKFAVVALTQSGAREFAEHNITVNGFCPGIVATELWRKLDLQMIEAGRTEEVGQGMQEFSEDILLRRVSTPEDSAGIAAFMASSDSDYMTGQCVQVDGGMILQ
tara:strand:+ start:119891 stop:120679 length:789 start_codon:yes stop_codon:yes gene_type:complete